MADHILADQKKDGLTVNLKFLSSKEMKKLNKDFRDKNLDTNVLSFPASDAAKKISGELGDIAMSIPYIKTCLLYTSPSPRDLSTSRMPSSA